MPLPWLSWGSHENAPGISARRAISVCYGAAETACRPFAITNDDACDDGACDGGATIGPQRA
jgi:hypothetical protein